MFIGIDASRANREQKTGIEWYAYHLLNAMKPISDPSDRFLLYTDTPLRDALRECPPQWEERVLHWLPRRLWTHGRLSLEMLFRAPDLLFIPSHVIPIGCGKRVVMTCHDIGFERHARLYPGWERAYHCMTMRYAVRRATHFIAVSEFTKQEMMEVYNLPAQRITVVRHGYFGGAGRSSQFQALHPKQSLISKLQSQTPYVLYVGRMEAKKNVRCIIDAFTELHAGNRIPENMRLVLVGKPGFQSMSIFAHLRSSPVAHLIEYRGWVPTDELRELYVNASLYLFPSFYEGFGFPLLEAMAAGVPVIASDIPALREVGGSAAVYAQPNANAFAEAIHSLLTEPKRIVALVAAGREHVKQYSWERAAAETLTVLYDAVS